MTFPTRRREACCPKIERASISIDPSEGAKRVQSKCPKKVERKESFPFITSRKLVVRRKFRERRKKERSAGPGYGSSRETIYGQQAPNCSAL